MEHKLITASTALKLTMKIDAALKLGYKISGTVTSYSGKYIIPERRFCQWIRKAK